MKRCSAGFAYSPIMPPPLLLLMCTSIAATLLSGARAEENTTRPSPPAYTFNADCSDHHHKEISCTAHAVQCVADASSLLPLVASDGQVSGEAHDIRIEPFAKALSSRQGGGYRLTVDISWQTPPNNSTRLLSAFLLEAHGGDGGAPYACFLMNISQSAWTSETVSSSPRLHFSTDAVFEFARAYDVTIHSLPSSATLRRSVRAHFSTPHNPGIVQQEEGPDASGHPQPSLNCTKYSNPFASRWTAGFRKIFIHSLARTIQVEFIAAPPQYCFEQYEVRLLDESGMELLHVGLVGVEDIRREGNNATTIFTGAFNFTDLEVNRKYIPSVIPVERAADGRCLCPVYGTDPYDNKVVCSCIAADWKPVEIRLSTQKEPAATVAPPLLQSTPSPDPPKWIFFLLFNVGIVVVLMVIGVMLYAVQRQYQSNRGKFAHIRFVNRHAHQNGGALLENGTLLPANGGAAGKAQSLLLSCSPNDALNLLIVYAHDSKEHEVAVEALAEFLRDVFHMDVALDVWERGRIETNMVDYLSSSVINADKVLVINSVGAHQRYVTKLADDGELLVERAEGADPVDQLFLAQLEMALQHHSLVSLRFASAGSAHVLPMLSGHLQYVLPDNLAPLLSGLVGRNVKQDPRLVGYSPQLARMQKAVEQMAETERTRPDWFAATHHKRRATKRAALARQRTTDSLKPCAPVLPVDEVAETALAEEEQPVVVGAQEEPVPVDAAPAETRLEGLEEPAPIHLTAPDSQADSGIFHSDECAPSTTTIIDETEAPLEEAHAQHAPLSPLMELECKRMGREKVENDDSGLVTDDDLRLLSAAS